VKDGEVERHEEEKHWIARATTAEVRVRELETLLAKHGKYFWYPVLEQ
jgi:hypothetical protein